MFVTGGCQVVAGLLPVSAQYAHRRPSPGRRLDCGHRPQDVRAHWHWIPLGQVTAASETSVRHSLCPSSLLNSSLVVVRSSARTSDCSEAASQRGLCCAFAKACCPLDGSTTQENCSKVRKCHLPCRQEVLEDMPPFLGGGEMIEVMTCQLPLALARAHHPF